jgi:hypothetical protein
MEASRAAAEDLSRGVQSDAGGEIVEVHGLGLPCAPQHVPEMA